MRPARIVPVENSLARVRPELAMDYRSHYDPTYDLVVYGIRDYSATMPSAEMQSPSSADLAGELDVIFQELAARQSRRPSPQTGAIKDDGKGSRWTAVATAASAWLKYHISRVYDMPSQKGQSERQTGMSAPAVGWMEYAEFADSMTARDVASNEAAGTSGTKKGVRSGDWLRHSAASSLHQLSLLLEAAAEEMDGAGQPAMSSIGN